jgi:hypothetical protein
MNRTLTIILRARNACTTALRASQGNVFVCDLYRHAIKDLYRAAELVRQGHHQIAEVSMRTATWHMEAAMQRQISLAA